MISPVRKISKRAAEALGIRFIEISEPTEIAPKLWLTGPVPRVEEHYNGPAGLFINQDGAHRYQTSSWMISRWVISLIKAG